MSAAAMEPRAAFQRAVAEHQATVLRICRSILRDDHLGADAAQEAFLRLWRRLSERSAPILTAAWLRRAAVSAAIDLDRRRRARAEAESLALAERADARAARSAEPGARPSAEPDARDPDPIALLAHAELEACFERAVARLPEGQRTVFLLRHSAGMPLAEVARSLGVALPTVKTQFARACLRMQAALRAFAPDEPR